MKYIINGKFLTQSLSGVQRYAIELTKGLVNLGLDVIIAVPNVPLQDKRLFNKQLKIIGKRNGVYWEQLELPRYVKSTDRVLINFANSAPLFLKNQLITIHDLGVYFNPNWYKWKFVVWYKLMTPIIAKRASLIFTVSKTAKSELQNILGIEAEKICVAYNGVSTQFDPQKAILPKENIILHVGTFSKRKNVELIEKAFIQASIQHYKLIFVGRKDDNLSFESSSLNAASIEILTDVSDAQLHELYQKSKILISASHYEGFGLPVLEGLVHQNWAIISDIPVYRELYSLGVRFFDPNNVQDLSEQLKKIVNEDQLFPSEYSDAYMESYSYEKSSKLVWKALGNKAN